MITLSNVKDFIQGYYNYFRNYLDNESIDKHIREQALYRAMLCQDCLNNGKCYICKCSTPAMFFSPHKQDSRDKWGAMLDKEEWEKYKIEHNIQLIQDFQDIMYDEIIKRYNFRVLNPEWFIYRGGNCFGKMKPSFLMALDELFFRVFDYGFKKNVIVRSFTDDIIDKNNEVVIDCSLLSNQQIYELINESTNMMLSLVVGTRYITISENPTPYFMVERHG